MPYNVAEVIVAIVHASHERNVIQTVLVLSQLFVEEAELVQRSDDDENVEEEEAVEQGNIDSAVHVYNVFVKGQ